MKKIKVLVGIEEKYTRDKIVNCFKYRSDYEVSIYDRDGSKGEEENKSTEYDIYWLEYEDLDFESLTQRKDRKVLFNSYCIRKGLIRKAQLAFYLQKYISKKQSSHLCKYIPETHVLQLDYLDYIDEALNDIYEVEEALKKNIENPKRESKKFILKSSMTNKGAEILIFDTRRQLERYFQRRISQNEDEMLDLREWVIQEYVDKPLLLKHYDWRKFHLRVYVLAVGNLRVYVYRDILALFAYKSYSHCTRLDEEASEESSPQIDICSHITNTCVQMDALAKEASEAEKRRAESECVKRFWDLRLAQGDGDDTDDQELTIDVKNAIYEQIKRCVAELFECFSCEPTVFQPLDNAFELYGLDFLIDRNFQVLFLEANAFPDFKQTGDSLNDLIDCLFYQTISAACDPHFGISPACDTDMLSLVFNKQLNR